MAFRKTLTASARVSTIRPFSETPRDFRCAAAQRFDARPQTVFTGGKGIVMAKTVCKILGVVFVIVGVAGFVAPTLLGAHLNPAHNAVHLVSGALALYLGFAGSAGAARGF